MSVPKSVTKFKTKNKNCQIEYISSVDVAKYSITELTRAALRDVGKYLCRLNNMEAQKLPGMKRSKRVRGGKSAFQYWARKKECDLQVGVKHGTWYGEHQELGTSKMKRHGIMRDNAYNHIPQIIEIESKYLSALQSEAEALALCSEEEYQGGADD